MFNFLRNMFKMKRLTAEQLQRYVPNRISQEQYEAIIKEA